MKKTTQQAAVKTSQANAKKDIFAITPTEMKAAVGGIGVVISFSPGNFTFWR